MNIFIMILVALFMTGYYMVSAPSQRVTETETEVAVSRADMHGTAECALAMHNAQIKGYDFTDICAEQNKLRSEFICLDRSGKETKCDVVRDKKPDFSYIVTSSAPIADNEYNDMMGILEEYYSDAGTFGIFVDGKIMSGGTNNRRPLPDAIVKKMELVDGQLVYMTQYEMPDTQTEFSIPYAEDVDCPAGTAKTYRFGRWQCVPINTKTDCAGDTIWDSDLLECVADESRKPLCGGNQTAVLVDTLWECIDPFPEKACPDDMVARLNYSTLEWECVADPTAQETVKKCANFVATIGVGTTLRVQAVSCTDCERMITDQDTCRAVCVPDPTKLNDPKCYEGASACSGDDRALYFGFPSTAYAQNMGDALAGKYIPIDKEHAQNRKFNCLVCPMGGVIDVDRSVTPYTAVCK